MDDIRGSAQAQTSPDDVEARLADVRGTFDGFDGYDDFIRTFVPGYEEMLDIVAFLVAAQVPEARCLLDLGIGTGAVTRRLLARLPAAHVVGIDFAPGMLGRAAELLVDSADRLTFVQGDLRDFALPPGVDAVDAAVSCLAVHHLEDADKAALFARLGSLIQPGGIFVLGDIVVLPERLGELAHEWRLDAVRRTSAGPQLEPEDGLERAHDKDRPATAEDQARWLIDAGFAETAVVWQLMGLAVIAAVRT